VDDEREQRELEVIHHQMEGTRASLAGKIETLENQVLGTVQTAASTVTETVEDVKGVVGTVTESVQEAVQSVKETFNLAEQTRRHPWPMLGGSVAAGFLGGWLLGPSRRKEEERAPGPYQAAPFVSPLASTAAPAPIAEKPEESEGSGIVQSLKGLAVGTLMGVLRSMLSTSLPEGLRPNVVGIVDDLTAKLGGQPIHDPLGWEEAAEQGNGQHAAPASTADESPARSGRATASAGRR
jgi:ElaB/YqjD/DUF883 family membrane-anchored ribosome-binding protein